MKQRWYVVNAVFAGKFRRKSDDARDAVREVWRDRGEISISSVVVHQTGEVVPKELWQ